MALPYAENLAYRGMTSGNVQCMAYRGFVCGVIAQTWKKIIEFTVYLTRQINLNVQR